ncbi:MAG: LPS-assembly lipoprotein LptE [Lysobacteraceae bacterium]
MKRLLLAACLLPALAGCGFHLRNALLLPPDLGPVQVVSRDPHSQLARDLREALQRAGAQVAPDGAPAAAVAGTGTDGEPQTGDGASGKPAGVAQLQLVSERWGNSPLSVDAQGRAQEYTLRYAVIFRLRRADGTDLVPQQVQELSRDYIASPALASGTEGEREILTQELRREMANSILRRVDAVSRMAQEHPQDLPAAPAPDGGTATP